MTELERIVKLYYYTTFEASLMLRCHVSTLRQMCRNGKVEAQFFEGQWYVKPGEITKLKCSKRSYLL